MSNLFSFQDLQDLISNRNYKCLVHTENGHYKFYIIEFARGLANIQYGRIGNNPVHTSYSEEQGRQKFKEKIRKGYKEVSSLDDLKNLFPGIKIDE